MQSPRHRHYCNRYFALAILLATSCRVQSLTEKERINALVRRWAPMIWLAPGENFFPLSIEDFLEHVIPINKSGRVLNITELSSEVKFLYPKTTGDLQKGSFIYGKNPSKEIVPVYATVTNCNSNKNQNAIEETNLNFHVTYWMFYPYNRGKDACIVHNFPVPIIFNRCAGQKAALGNHLGDFEHISLYFGGKGHPDLLYVSTHNSGAYYKFDPKKEIFQYQSQESSDTLQKPKFPIYVHTINQRPILFSAKGSHGLWSQPGIHHFTLVRIPGLTDYVGYGVPWKTWLKVKIYHLGQSKMPSWMKYDGKWGTAKYNCLSALKFELCEFSDGPNGILKHGSHFQCSRNL